MTSGGAILLHPCRFTIACMPPPAPGRRAPAGKISGKATAASLSKAHAPASLKNRPRARHVPVAPPLHTLQPGDSSDGPSRASAHRSSAAVTSALPQTTGHRVVVMAIRPAVIAGLAVKVCLAIVPSGASFESAAPGEALFVGLVRFGRHRALLRLENGPRRIAQRREPRSLAGSASVLSLTKSLKKSAA
jgi:hypothetical protein